MKGSLQKKGKIYYAVISTKNNNNNYVTKWISTKCTNKKEAKIVLEDILSKLEKNKFIIPSNTKFCDFIKLWLNEIIKNKVENTTYEGYSIQINKHIIPYFKEFNLKIQEVNILHIEKYIFYKYNNSENKLSANTLKKHYHNIKQIFDYAIKLNLINKNPALNVSLPKVEKFVPNYYSVEQLSKLLSIAKGHALETAIYLTVHYGLRRGEILGLRWQDVNFEECTLSIKNTRVKVKSKVTKKPKTQASIRTFPLLDNISKHLKKVKKEQDYYKSILGSFYKDNDYICKYSDGTLYSTDKVSKGFTALILKNNMPKIRFHDLRHSTASYLLKLGLHMKEIQEWLGHSDFYLTANTYSHIDTEMKKNAANKINNLFKNND
jgi:integrase